MTYNFPKWKPFLPCSNISTYQCDLSEAFIPRESERNGYFAKVNAVTESQKSSFAHTYRFTFDNNATLGPPTVHLKADEVEITVEINYTVPNFTVNMIRRIFKILSYNIYYRNSENPEQENKICREKNPYIKIKVPVGVTCVSAEVCLDALKVKGERSQETCLQIKSSESFPDSRKLPWSPALRREDNIIPLNETLNCPWKEGDKELEYQGDEEYTWDEEYSEDEYHLGVDDYPEEEEPPSEMYPVKDENSVNTSDELESEAVSKLQRANTESSRELALAISGGVFIFIILVVVAITLICYFLKKQQALPKHLAQHIMRGKTYTNVSMKTEESDISILTSMEAVTNICEVDTSRNATRVEVIKAPSEVIDADRVNTDVDDSEPVNTDLNDPYAAKIGLNGTDQKNVNENCFEEDNSDLEKTHDLCKTNFDSVMQTCADNWGYDKPQNPLVL
ncbi:uncharacterized protein LOC121278245 [Carcharodon carcharias]|uniref:uncharacterized protein LOC121278245 n=1 Tax=Carcharodon carcharias TaxID=13397 RepID=UPI001B7DA980|nr:uncharacterized protein LOC121278245 [Carcharodon carcharias]